MPLPPRPGFYLRRGMPEPHAFLEAAKREKLAACRTFTQRQLSLARDWDAAEAAREVEEAAAKRCGGRAGQGGRPALVTIM